MAPTRSYNSTCTSRASNHSLYASAITRNASTNRKIVTATVIDCARYSNFDQAAADFEELKKELSKIQHQHCEAISFQAGTSVMDRIDIACKKRGISKHLLLPNSFIMANRKKIAYCFVCDRAFTPSNVAKMMQRHHATENHLALVSGLLRFSIDCFRHSTPCYVRDCSWTQHSERSDALMSHFKTVHLNLSPSDVLPIHIQRWMDEVRIKKMLAKDTGVKEHLQFHIPDELLTHTPSPSPSLHAFPLPSMSPSPTPSLRSVSPMTSSGSSAPSYTPAGDHAQLLDFSHVASYSPLPSTSSWVTPGVAWQLPEEKLYLSPMPQAAELSCPGLYTYPTQGASFYQPIQLPQIPRFSAPVNFEVPQPQFDPSMIFPSPDGYSGMILNGSGLDFNRLDSADWSQAQALAPVYDNSQQDFSALYTPADDASLPDVSLNYLADFQLDLSIGAGLDAWFGNESNGLGLQLGFDAGTGSELASALM